MSYPATWKVRAHEGYLALLQSADGVVEYEMFLEPIEGSFSEYRDGVEASTNFEGSPGERVSMGELAVDGSEGFFIQTDYAPEPPPDWAGEEYCRGCVQRNYAFNWRPGEVLNVGGGAERDWDGHESTIERIIGSLRHA